MRRGVRITASAMPGLETRTSRASRGRSMTSDLLRPSFMILWIDCGTIAAPAAGASARTKAVPASKAATAKAAVAPIRSLRRNGLDILKPPRLPACERPFPQAALFANAAVAHDRDRAVLLGAAD